MSANKQTGIRTLALAVALAVALVSVVSALSPHFAAAQGWGPGTVRDHRARLCRAVYSPHPSTPSYPWTSTLCSLRTGNTDPVGTFCTCSVLVEGHYMTAGGKVVLASHPY